MADTLDLGNLLVHLNMSTTQYLGAMKMAEGKLIAFSNKMTAIGRQLSLRVTLPLLLIGAGATKAFASFDDAMTKSLAIMNGVTPKLRGEMEELATTMSDQTVTSATDLAKSYFFLASAGFNVKQSMASLNAVNQFAIAGNFDMALATDLVTDAQSALGLTVKDVQKNLVNMTRVTDVLVGANTLANATVQQFSEALTGQAGPAMKAYGIELEEGVAVLAAFADQGIKGALASSTFGRFLRLLTKGALENQAAWKRFNIEVFDASEKLKPLSVIIGDISTVLGGMSPKMQFVTLDLLGFKARAQQAILPLLGLQDRIKKYNEELDAMGGITDRVANKNMASFSAQMAIVRNQVVNAGRDIGRILAPTILALGDKLKAASRAWKGLSESTKEVVVRIGLLAAAAGPALLIISALTKMVIALGTASLLSASSLLLIAAALVVIKNAPQIGKFLFDEFKIAQQASTNFLINLQKGWLLVSFGFKAMVLEIRIAWDATMNTMKRALAGLLEGFGNIPGMKRLKQAAEDLRNSISTVGRDALENLKIKLAEDIKLLEDTRAKVFTKIEIGFLEKDSNAAAKNILEKTIAELTEKFKGLEKLLGNITVEEQRLLQPLTEWGEHAVDVVLRVNEVFASAFERMGDELADFLIEGKANFADFAKSILKDLLAIAIRAQVVFPIASALGFLGPAAITGAAGVAASPGGAGFVGPPVPLASGGIVTSPTLAVIGEGGRPEAVIPLNGGAVPVQFSGGRQEAPTIIINNNTGSAFKQEGAPTFDGKNFIIGIVAENINQNGALRQLIGGINNFSG